jgi:hypothetical protein
MHLSFAKLLGFIVNSVDAAGDERKSRGAADSDGDDGFSSSSSDGDDGSSSDDSYDSDKTAEHHERDPDPTPVLASAVRPSNDPRRHGGNVAVAAVASSSGEWSGHASP